MSPLVRNILLAATLAAIVSLGYFIFFRADNSALLTNSATGALGETDVLVENEMFLGRLQELQTLKIDSSIFNDVRFVSLFNFRRDLVDEKTGRPNPFRPVGE